MLFLSLSKSDLYFDIYKHITAILIMADSDKIDVQSGKQTILTLFRTLSSEMKFIASTSICLSNLFAFSSAKEFCESFGSILQQMHTGNGKIQAEIPSNLLKKH